MLEVKNLSKSFKGIQACRNVSFTLSRQEIMCVSGRNGSGKTTLINLLAGTLFPDFGELRLDGSSFRQKSPHVRRKLGISRSFQWPRFFSEWRVEDNIKFACDTVCLGSGNHLDIGRLLEMFDLVECTGKVAENLTACEKKLLDMAMTFAGQPQVVLLDEPCAGLLNDKHPIISTAISTATTAWGARFLIVDHNLDFLEGLRKVGFAKYGVMTDGNLSLQNDRSTG